MELSPQQSWPLSRASLRLDMAWAEDRAMLGSNPSADPGAEMGRGGVPLCPCCLLAKKWPALGRLL
jgi:hypothetical protein